MELNRIKLETLIFSNLRRAGMSHANGLTSELIELIADALEEYHESGTGGRLLEAGYHLGYAVAQNSGEWLSIDPWDLYSRCYEILEGN